MQIYTFLFYREIPLRSIEFLNFSENIYIFSKYYSESSNTLTRLSAACVRSIVPVA